MIYLSSLVFTFYSILGICLGEPALFTNNNPDTNVVYSNYGVSAKDVSIYFYSRVHQNAIKFNSTDVSQINKTDFDQNKQTFFIVHGWHNSHLSESSWAVKEAMLSVHDVNVFLIDWQAIMKKGLTARAACALVGIYLSDFVELLVEYHSLSLLKTTLIGHGVGAHVVGVAGAALNGNVSAIVGLDPTRHMFSDQDGGSFLNTSGAKFVQVIHTSGGMIGIDKDMGHADYWVNGGESQPGCILDLLGLCAHERSHEYFSESMTTNNFVATKCDDYSNYNDGKCKGNHKSSMGMVDIDTSASGKYFLKTNDNSPYAIGNK